MSRVEPKDRSDQDERRTRERNENESRGVRQPVDRTPGKAEGDERTIDEALRNEE